MTFKKRRLPFFCSFILHLSPPSSTRRRLLQIAHHPTRDVHTCIQQHLQQHSSLRVQAIEVEPSTRGWSERVAPFVAEHFFVPALTRVAASLRLPDDVAGATLLSFGNGAPAGGCVYFAHTRACLCIRSISPQAHHSRCTPFTNLVQKVRDVTQIRMHTHHWCV